MLSENKKTGFGESFEGQTSKTVEKSFESTADAIGTVVYEKGKKIVAENQELAVKTVKRGIGCILIIVGTAITILALSLYFLYQLFT